MTVYYVVFERCLDPQRETPVGVYLSENTAESSMYGRKAVRSLECNESRAQRFKDGEAVGRRVTIQDFDSQFYIVTVEN